MRSTLIFLKAICIIANRLSPNCSSRSSGSGSSSSSWWWCPPTGLAIFNLMALGARIDIARNRICGHCRDRMCVKELFWHVYLRTGLQQPSTTLRLPSQLRKEPESFPGTTALGCGEMVSTREPSQILRVLSAQAVGSQPRAKVKTGAWNSKP